MNGKDLTIGVLSVTAVVLLTGLIIIHAALPQSAMAFGQTASLGPYVATTSQVDAFVELLVVVDSDAHLMNVYGFDGNVGRIELIQQVDVLQKRRDK